jgi:hypothetical protein
MRLYLDSDASYLSEPQAGSRVGGYSTWARILNRIRVESRIMKNAMATASDSEIGALFHNGQEGAYIRQILKELGR